MSFAAALQPFVEFWRQLGGLISSCGLTADKDKIRFINKWFDKYLKVQSLGAVGTV